LNDDNEKVMSKNQVVDKTISNNKRPLVLILNQPYFSSFNKVGNSIEYVG
jgi:hypothetical protein